MGWLVASVNDWTVRPLELVAGCGDALGDKAGLASILAGNSRSQKSRTKLHLLVEGQLARDPGAIAVVVGVEHPQDVGQRRGLFGDADGGDRRAQQRVRTGADAVGAVDLADRGDQDVGADFRHERVDRQDVEAGRDGAGR